MTSTSTTSPFPSCSIATATASTTTLILRNATMLQTNHNDCLAWAARHGTTFAPQKYELMHLTRSRKFNMSASVQLPGGLKAPSPTVRVLGVLLGSKLRWGPRIRQTSDRATQQCRALTALSGSTWGASFAKARLIYSAVVRPCLTYGSTIWAPLEGTLRPAQRRWIGEPLERIQQQCLRAVTGTFRATNRQTLEKEAAIPPLRAHIARLQLQARARLEASGVRQETDRACRHLHSHLAAHQGPRRPPALHRAKCDACGPRVFFGVNSTAWRTPPSLSASPPGRTTPAQTPARLRPATTPHNHCGKPTSWQNSGAGTGGKSSKEDPPTPPPLRPQPGWWLETRQDAAQEGNPPAARQPPEGTQQCTDTDTNRRPPLPQPGSSAWTSSLNSPGLGSNSLLLDCSPVT